MSSYIEYCPRGLTKREIKFEIKGDRKPSPTNSCICGGSEEERVLSDAALTATMFNSASAIIRSFDAGGKEVAYTTYRASVHSSEIRKA